MTDRFEEISRRKQALIERCARDRETVATSFNRIRLPSFLGLPVAGLGRMLIAHPLAVAGVSSLLVSGYGRKLRQSAGKILKLSLLIRPLWSWWSARRRRK